MFSTDNPCKVAVIGFDHMHAGDFIRAASEHPRAGVAALWGADGERMAKVAADFRIDAGRQFTDAGALLRRAQPDLAVVCSTTHDHVKWVQYLAGHHVPVMVEKPFATSLDEADAMIEITRQQGVPLAVNWPLAWYPPHRTCRRLIAEGIIGAVREVHYYDGNRGPLNHLHDKKAVDAAQSTQARRASWWYQAEQGGGSLLDYLGYGTTISTWFRDGEMPAEITARTYIPPGEEVDEQAVVIAEYTAGLSTYQTRWGTFTDPWSHQPQPRCGFVVVGTAGTIASYDYQDTIRVQTKEQPEGSDVPVDTLPLEQRNGLAAFIDALERGTEPEGPISWRISRAGQVMVDAARQSARTGRTVQLTELDAKDVPADD
jgi:predicted dehydrogenase